MIQCPFCGYNNEDGSLFCEQCKSELPETLAAGSPVEKPVSSGPPIGFATPAAEAIPAAEPLPGVAIAEAVPAAQISPAGVPTAEPAAPAMPIAEAVPVSPAAPVAEAVPVPPAAPVAEAVPVAAAPPVAEAVPNYGAGCPGCFSCSAGSGNARGYTRRDGPASPHNHAHGHSIRGAKSSRSARGSSLSSGKPAAPQGDSRHENRGRISDLRRRKFHRPS
jgi:hypothetical protein